MQEELYTVGHSTHSLAYFLWLLEINNITAICDVRSHPFSKHVPHFNKEALKSALHAGGIAYGFLGSELGARSPDPACYEKGRVVYDRLAKTDEFHCGIRKLRNGMRRHRVALLCSERDPITCHRTILICRHLRSEVPNIYHVLASGELEANEKAELRLLREWQLQPSDLFTPNSNMIEHAYSLQAEKIAYSLPLASEARDLETNTPQ